MNMLVPVKAKPWGWRRFHPGDTVETVHELIRAIDAGRWLYFGSTPKHPTILNNMSLATLRGHVRMGRIRYAMENHAP